MDIAELVHNTGAKLYYDEPTSRVMRVRPRYGFDAVHMNLHKTFHHPPAGAVRGWTLGVKAELVPFLPTPTWSADDLKLDLSGRSQSARPQLLRQLRHAGRRTHTSSPWRRRRTQASLDAVLSANYLRKRVEGQLDIPSPGP